MVSCDPSYRPVLPTTGRTERPDPLRERARSRTERQSNKRLGNSSMKVTIEKNELVIRIPMSEPAPSQSGKNLIVASTHGNVKTDCLHPKTKQPITVSVNAYFKPQA